MYGRFQRYPCNTVQRMFSQPNDKIPTRTLGLLPACWCWLAAFAAAGLFNFPLKCKKLWKHKDYEKLSNMSVLDHDNPF